MSIKVVRAGVLRTLTRWLGRLILLAFALVVMGSLVVTVVLPRATHGSALTVLTGSMTPGIPVGSVVVVRPVDPGTLRVGDVATYQVAPGKEAFITHRVLEIDRSISPAQFVFKGDANPGPDVDSVPAGAIRGKVWFHVPYLGAIRDALHGKGGISLVAMLVLAGYALTQLSGAFKDGKRRAVIIQSGVSRAAERTVLRLPLDRVLLLADLPYAADCNDRLEHLADTARHWQGVVLRADDDSFTLLLAPPHDGIGAAEELLREAGAVTERWQPEPSIRPTTEPQTSRPHQTSKVTERVQS